MNDLIANLLQGVGHQRAGRPDLAEVIYRDVLCQDPAQPNALYLYGLLQLKDGRAAAAAAMLDAATRHRDDAELYLHLARARLAAGDPTAALVAIDQALMRRAPRGESLYLRGTALNALGQPDQAILALTEVVAIDAGHASAHLNLGNAYAEIDHLDEAERHIRTALARDSALIEAHLSLGHLLGIRGQLAAAVAACEAAVKLAPLSAEAHWNLATVLLLGGDYERGFSEYEWHREHPLFRAYWRELPGEAWNGGPLTGRTLLVHAGQGLGDTIQLARYAPELAARGARVVLACNASLIPLLSGQPGLSNVVSYARNLPRYDLWVDQMSLPRLLGTTSETVPGGASYLKADPARIQHWAERLGRAKIGFAWAGNPGHMNDHRRSLPPDIARQIARPGMVSLQVGARAAESADYGIQDLSAALTDYAETAGVIASLDLVITVDTSVAHLAGALGVPTWLMLPAAPDWRWILGRDDTPWYRSMRLFRQARHGDWSSVTHAIAANLEGSCRDGSPGNPMERAGHETNATQPWPPHARSGSGSSAHLARPSSAP